MAVRQIGHPSAFIVIAATTIAMMFGAAAPSPLYPVYQELWGFSSFTLTVIFAVYVLALLAGLLTVGSLSDHVGRRPVLLGGLAVLTASMAMFAFADGVPMLIAARVLQGLAAGAITGTLSAALVDLQPSPRAGSIASSASPPAGLALGAVGAGILVQYAPMPRELVFLVLIAAFIVAIVLIFFIPETSPRTGFTSRAHLWKVVRPNAGLPPAVRGVFLASVPAMFATWSLGGLYLSLGSSITARILGIENHMGAGLIIGSFFGSGAIGSMAASGWSAHRKLAIGLSTLGSGLVLSLVGTISANIPTYVVGSMVAGFGFGATFVGVVATLIAVTAPASRGQVFSTLFIVSYTGFSVPAVVAGFAVIHVGLRPTAIGYSAFVLALVIVAAIVALWRARTDRGAAPGAAADGTDLVTAAADTAGTSR
ncbi:putative MFS family arabinose efflux permease [Williamsia limnetica]|uniref:Putative MFS family arabinose efflux permease n=1 Tax=Williamsia limnetica TaxID=882452 RepID=A0A318RF04_WILLI|nr:MFS transporter [Williamsia limnetica]PYE15169.1 putative MFS family arabinose efflux permease [Williamsia limnetica]